VERYKKRMDANDAIAIFNVGCNYRDGTSGIGVPTKLLELIRRTADLVVLMQIALMGSRASGH